jgi:hypothetical protein
MPGSSRSSRFAALLVLAACLAAAFGCGEGGREAAAPLAAGRLGADLLAGVAPAALPSYVRDSYRLRPDRRFLLALAMIAKPAAGEPPAVVQAMHQEGRWKILVDGEEAGLLSELPDFPGLTEVLARQARPAAHAEAAADESAAAAAVERAIGAVDAEALAAALAAPGLDRRSAAVGLAWLATLATDSLDQTDPLLAAAWAAVAVEREPRAEVLLARALGYDAAAAEAAIRLAEDDPLRPWAGDDEPGLAALCARRPEERTCSFLHLALLAERGRGERFAAVLAASPLRHAAGSALPGLRIRLADFDYGKPGRELAEKMLASLGLPAEAGSRDFEAALDQLGEQLASRPPAALRAALLAWRRAAYYSGIYNQARFALDLRASATDAENLAKAIEPAAAGTAEELQRYLLLRAAVLGGSREMAPLADFMASSRALGAPPLFALARIIARQVTTTDRLRRQPIPAFFAGLDTRPAHRLIAARVARDNLTSPYLHEKLARAAAEAAPHRSEELPALAAELREDGARLRQIAGDEAMPQYARVVALGALSRLGQADDAFVRAHYQAFADDPDGSSQWLLAFLESRGDRAGALAAIDAALARRGHPLTEAYLRSKKAELQLAMGQPDAAFATIRPALASGKEDALLQGAAIELARRRPQSALKLAQEALGRYPEGAAEAAGLVARARWQMRDGATAARELAADPGGILGAWIGALPAAFADSFAAAPEGEVRQAFGQLVEAGIPHRVLGRAGIALGERRDHRLTLSLLGRLSEPAPEWRDQLRLQTYDLIARKAGKREALAFIRAALPADSHNFALTLYQMRRYELLLDLFSSGQEGENSPVVRLLKAASHLHLEETSGKRWEEFLAEVEEEPKNDFSPLTRVLVAKGDGAESLAGLGGRDRATLGWLFGVKAASAGRYVEADGWFQVAIESGLEGQPPHAWAWVVESGWIEARRSLELLGSRKEFHPGAAAAAAPAAGAGLAKP